MSRLKELGVIGDGIHKTGNWRWTYNDKFISTISYESNTINQSNAWIRVYYTNTSTQEKQDYKIRLSTSSPHYGGRRWWFHCPVAGCNKRVGVLYLATIFACRHCRNLAYPSQNQALYDRYMDRAFELARKLGHDGDMISGFDGDKPKGMHWKTYERKKEILDSYTGMGVLLANRKFKGLFDL